MPANPLLLARFGPTDETLEGRVLFLRPPAKERQDELAGRLLPARVRIIGAVADSNWIELESVRGNVF
ncbi:MAG: hypothetical protein KGI97_06270, partial [Alphaproteobacteria bacterium]|nr:hypothetical protein [Alphaproteobacteria bacterium]